MKKMVLLLTAFSLLIFAGGCFQDKSAEPLATSTDNASVPIVDEDFSAPENTLSPEPFTTEAQSTAVFALGPEHSTPKRLTPGDVIGGWTLDDFQISYSEDDAFEWMSAEFTGSVTLAGSLSRYDADASQFLFTVSEEDAFQIPVWLSTEAIQPDTIAFLVYFTDETGEELAGYLNARVALPCEIVLSSYSCIYITGDSMNYASAESFSLL